MADREWWRAIFGSSLRSLSYEAHPSEKILHCYIDGGLERGGRFELAALEQGQPTRRAEVTAHLLTCQRCADLVASWHAGQRARSRPIREWLSWTAGRSAQPLPAFARAVIATQFAVILGLSGLIYFKPQPFFSSQTLLENPAATVLSPARTSKEPNSPESLLAAPQTAQREDAYDIAQLIANLNASDPQLRLRAAQLLGESSDPRAIAALSEILGVEDNLLQTAAAQALQRIQERFFQQAVQLGQRLLERRLSVRSAPAEPWRSHISTDLYPFTLRVTFREEAPAREIEQLVRRFNALLTYQGQIEQAPYEFVLQLPAGAARDLDEIIRELSTHPQIRTVRR